MDILLIVSTLKNKPSNIIGDAKYCPRSLGATIILTLSWLSVELHHFVPDIHELQSLVISNIRPWATSSLSDVVSILEEMQRKTRLRSRFDELGSKMGK